MALDPFFTHQIEQRAHNALSDYYARGNNSEFPLNPYQPGTEEYRAWQQGAHAAAAKETMRMVSSHYKQG